MDKVDVQTDDFMIVRESIKQDRTLTETNSGYAINKWNPFASATTTYTLDDAFPIIPVFPSNSYDGKITSIFTTL